MEFYDDQDGDADSVDLRWPLCDVIDALARLETSASLTASALLRAGGAGTSTEEWPAVIFEDILDADLLEE